MEQPKRPLWRDGDFLKFWGGQSFSYFGAHISSLALPLVAVITLDATPQQMGILGFVQYIPWLLVAVLAGLFADRNRRRPLMIGADLTRASLLAMIPIGVFLGFLRMAHLLAITFLIGVAAVVFDVSMVAYLPSFVSGERLIEGNQKIQISASAAEVVGPGLAGIITQALSAPIAMGLTSLSYLASASSLIWVHKPEPPTPTRAERGSVLSDLRIGFRPVLTHPLLRAFTGTSTLGNLVIDMNLALYVLYLTEEIGIGPATLGVIYTIGGAGGVIGAILAHRLAGASGTGRTIYLSQLSHGLCMTALPLVATLGVVAVPLLAMVHFIWGMTSAIYAILALSLRQAFTPNRLQGRVNASFRALTIGIAPVGFLIGGALGELIGLQPTLLIAGVGLILSNVFLVFSPLSSVRALTSLPSELMIADA